MKDFIIRALCLLLIVGMVAGYSIYADKNKNTDKVETSYTDGTYTGEAKGFGGEISVEVLIKDGRIDSIDIVSAEKEDKSFLETAKAIIPDIIDHGSADVDTISGATYSSTGIKNAVAAALEKAQ